MSANATGPAGNVAVPHAGTRIRPDRDAAPFVAALREGRLAVQRCDSCATLRWPARAVCNRCCSMESTWVDLTGRGKLVSWTVTHHAVIPELVSAAPYVVAQVALDEQDDLVIPASFIGDIGELRMGMSMQAVFTGVDDDVTLLQWRSAT